MAKSAVKTTKKSTSKTTDKKTTMQKPRVQKDTTAPEVPIIPIKPPEQHGIGLSILLHLLPGVLATVVYVLIAQPLGVYGIPPLGAFLISVLMTILPFEIGVLLWEARRKNQSNSLVGVVLYRAFLPWWQYIVFPLGLIAIAVVVYGGLAMLNPIIISTLFGWLPEWYRVDTIVENIGSYSRFGLILTVVLYAVINGVVGPIVEELYFRGYLLPRLSRYGKSAPVINIVLFSLYHLWTPWEIVARILGLLPMGYVVWWKKNIYLGMITHVVLNLIGTISLSMLILGQLPS